MIQANELRIGNWVQTYPSAKIEQVYDLMCDCINTKTKEKLPFDCVDPILLTPEILEKCGFRNYEDYKFYVDVMIIIKNGDGYLYLANQRHVNIFYLHQLQNLYFALTGEELQYIPQCK